MRGRKLQQPKIRYEQSGAITPARLEAVYDFLFRKALEMKHRKEKKVVQSADIILDKLNKPDL